MGCTQSSAWNEAGRTQLNENLSERQIQLVRDTWDLLSDDMERTGMIIFTNLFQIDNDLKGVFTSLVDTVDDADDDIRLDDFLLRKHSSVVMEALGAAVECLEDSEFLSGVLVALGQIHATHQVKSQYLPRLWPAIRFGLKEVLQDVFTEEVEEAWKTVFSYIITKMREGIKKERKGDQRNSITQPAPEEEGGPITKMTA